MNRIKLLMALVALVIATRADKPNLIFILADDMGHGNVSCLNPKAQI